MTDAARVLHREAATRAPGTPHKSVSDGQPPACDTARAAAGGAPLPQLTDPHPALGQFAGVCFPGVSCWTASLPMLQRFTNSHAGLSPSEEIPSEATVSTRLLFLR